MARFDRERVAVMSCIPDYVSLVLDGGRLTVRGELDHAAVPALLRLLERLDATPPATLTVVVDELHFVDCAGLRALRQLWSRLDARCVVLSVSGRSPILERVSQLSGLDLPWVVSDLAH